MAGGAYFEVEARVVAPGVVARVAALIEPAAQAIERRLQEAIRRGLEGSGTTSRTEGGRQGLQFGDAFSRTLKTRLEAAFRSLPEVKLKADSSDVDKEIFKIREEIKRILTDDTYRIELGIDDKEVLAKVEEMRLRLERLARTSPDIRVRVNSGAALAELEAIQRVASDNKRGNIFTRLISDARASSASFDLVAGKVSTVGSAVSGLAGNNLAGTLALVAAIVAALSTVGPIVAALSGAFLGVGAAVGVAVAAVVGLKKQMQFGTGVGNIIQQEFKGISAQFSNLAELAANAFGPAVANVASFLKAQLPTFQGLVTLVGGRLGGAFREVGVAVITAFQKASPLIVQVLGYIEQGAAALRRWVAGPGFNSFILYASRELPVVIDFAKSLGSAIIGIFKALAPLGEALLKILTPVLNLIGSVGSGLASVFGNLFGTANTADKSFAPTNDLLKSFQALSDGAAATAGAAAPLDNYRKIIGDLAPALQAAAGNSGQFQVAVTGVTDRLRNATPELQTFMDTASSFDPASAKLGDVAKLLGDALTASRGFALDYTASLVGADVATLGFAKAVHDNLSSVAKDGTLLGVSHLDAAGKFVAAAGEYTQGSADITSAFQSQVKAATDAATATYTQVKSSTGDSAKAANDALTVYKGLREQVIQQGLDAGFTAEQVNGLADSYFAIPSSVDTFVELLGQNNVNLAIQGLTDALNRLSDFIGAPKVTLDPAPVNDAVAGMNAGLDYFGHRVDTPTALLNSGGFAEGIGQANNQLDRFGLRIVGATITVNDNASAKLLGVGRLLDDLNGRRASVYVNTNTGGQTAPGFAKGGILDGHTQLFADGGVISQVMVNKLKAKVPAFATGGIPANITAVPRAIYGEAGPEAYIPLTNDSRRQRALMLWGETGRRLGVEATAAAPAQTVVATDPAVLDRLGAIEAAVHSNAAQVAGAYLHAVDQQVSRQGLVDSNRPR